MLLEPKPTVGGKIVIPQESADVNDLGHQPRCGDRADPTDLLERLDCHVRLILPRCQVETNYPWPGCDAANPIGIGGQATHSFSQTLDHQVHLIQHHVGKCLLPQFIPDVFLRIERWRVPREWQQTDILGHDQILALM